VLVAETLAVVGPPDVSAELPYKTIQSVWFLDCCGCAAPYQAIGAAAGVSDISQLYASAT
jgi:hypothetical protein